MAKNKRTVRWILIGVLGCGLLYWLVVPPREPVYKGKKLGVWLREFDPPGRTEMRDTKGATEAVQHAGTEAIPTLLRMLQAHDSAPSLKMYALFARQRVIRFTHVPADNLNAWAAWGFLALGDKASNAVPDLVRIYEKKISASSQARAAAALGYIGPAASAAVPSLLRGLSDADWEVRRDAIWALGQIHEEPHTVVPALILELRDTGKPPNNVAGIPNSVLAAQSLGAFGEDARRATPALAGMATNLSDTITSWYALDALRKIDPAAAEALRGAGVTKK